MRIVIDKREGELIIKTNEALQRLGEEERKHIEIVLEDLHVGDVLIQTDDTQNLLIIERKTFPDLLASIKDGRYAEQSHRLMNTSDVPKHNIIYLLEGMFSTVQPYQKKIIYSCMTSIQYFKNFSVMRTSSVYETGEWLIAMTEKIGRDLTGGRVCRNLLPPSVEPPSEVVPYCNFVKKVKKENITPENIGEIVLSQIPGISSVTAIAIMKKFSTFPKLMSALNDDPCSMDDIVTETNGKVRKISKRSIENIKKFFT